MSLPIHLSVGDCWMIGRKYVKVAKKLLAVASGAGGRGVCDENDAGGTPARNRCSTAARADPDTRTAPHRRARCRQGLWRSAESEERAHEMAGVVSELAAAETPGDLRLGSCRRRRGGRQPSAFDPCRG